MLYNFDFDIAAIVINVLLLTLIITRRSFPSRKRKFYIFMLLSSLFATIADIFTVYSISFPSNYSNFYNYFVNIVYYFFHNLTSLLFVLYGIVAENFTPKHRYAKYVIGSLTAIVLISILTTGLTGLAFSFEGGYYHSGAFLPLYYVTGVAAVLYVIYIKLTLRHKLTGFQTLSHIIYVFLLAASFVLHAVYKNLLIELFAVNVGFLILYISQDNPEAYFYKGLSAFNRKGYDEYLLAKVNNKHGFSIIYLTIKNYYEVDSESDDLIFAKEKQIVYLLKHKLKFKKRRIYVLDHLYFAIFVDKGEEKKSISDLKDMFKEPLLINEKGYFLSMSYGLMKYPQMATSYEQAEQITDHMIQKLKEDESNHIVEPDYHSFDKDRENEIINALRKMVDTKNMEIEYEPICSSKLGTCLNAEAVLVLYDDSGERIDVREFLPIAEKTGIVIDIDLLKIVRISEFLKRSVVHELGIKSINVNMTSTTLVEPGFLENVKSLIKKYNIDTSKINIEYTDNGVNVNKEAISNAFTILKDFGFLLTLDGYGSGYLNPTILLDSKFDMVKIGKDTMEQVRTRNNGKALLKGYIDLLKSIGKVTLCDGVESIYERDIVKECGCEYFQGPVLGKPFTEENYLLFVKKQLRTILDEINNN